MSFLSGRQLRAIYNARVSTIAIDENWVVVFAKRPSPGRVKTRLAGLLGSEGASRLYGALLADTLLSVGCVRGARPVITCTPSREQTWFASNFGEDFSVTDQGSGDLGARMSRCFDDAFMQGARRVVVVGSDLPTLSSECIENAFDMLRSHDLTLGPADDGGYYLIGLSRSAPELFDGIDWSTERVFAQTVERARRCGLSLSTLATECDVDDESSLRTLMATLAESANDGRAPNTRRFLEKLNGKL